MTHNAKDADGSANADLLKFVQQKLPALSEAFANLPLMQMRVSTPHASITLVKARPQANANRNTGAAQAAQPEPEHAGARRPLRALHEYVPDGEPGRAFDTVSAEVVGIFHVAPDLPALGEHVDADKVLGYIEALKLRTPVKAGIEGRLMGQVAEDGQPVDFGETLFVVDSGPAEPVPEEQPVDPEPPRI